MVFFIVFRSTHPSGTYPLITTDQVFDRWMRFGKFHQNKDLQRRQPSTDPLMGYNRKLLMVE